MNRTTIDPTDPRLGKGPDDEPVSQNEVYLVLSEDERAKGFVRPLRYSYVHVGERPKHETRELTEDEKTRYREYNYVLFETYPKTSSAILGRFWTEEQLARDACNTTTTMSRDIAETYARNPRFYGSTYCVGCSKHLPLSEFVWKGSNLLVGS